MSIHLKNVRRTSIFPSLWLRNGVFVTIGSTKKIEIKQLMFSDNLFFKQTNTFCQKSSTPIVQEYIVVVVLLSCERLKVKVEHTFPWNIINILKTVFEWRSCATSSQNYKLQSFVHFHSHRFKCVFFCFYFEMIEHSSFDSHSISATTNFRAKKCEWAQIVAAISHVFCMNSSTDTIHFCFLFDSTSPNNRFIIPFRC